MTNTDPTTRPGPHITTIYTGDGVIERSYCDRCRRAFTDPDDWTQIVTGLFVHRDGCQRDIDLDNLNFTATRLLCDDTGRPWATDGHCIIATTEDAGRHLPPAFPSLDVAVAKASSGAPVALCPWRPEAQLPPLAGGPGEYLVRHSGGLCAVLEREDRRLTLVQQRYWDLICGSWPMSAFVVEQLGDQSAVIRVTELDGEVVAYVMPVCDAEAAAHG